MQDAPERLRCEYLEDPLGIDVTRPRLSWCLGDRRPAERQSAYQLLAASHPDLLALDEGDFWDTGRVEGQNTTQIEYAGKPLTSGRQICWKVRSFDSDGLPSPWSGTASFEAGLLKTDDWQGSWISAGIQGSRLQGAPVPVLCRQFDCAGPVRQGRLYVAALGLVAVQLNGIRLAIGEQVPGWVDYQQRAAYLTIDVSGYLRAGGNSLAILLADGWYAGDPGSGYRQQYGDRAELLVQLDAVADDGASIRLGTDAQWRWRPSWLLGADPTRGEDFDGRRFLADWGAGNDWYPVTLGQPAARRSLKLRAAGPSAASGTQPVEPRRTCWLDDGSGVRFEFPEPVMGRARLGVTAPTGGALRIRYGLETEPDGRLLSLGEDSFVAAGDESGETLEALFSVHGFRYLELTGDVYRQDGVEVTAIPVRLPLARTSSLVSDHPRIDALYQAMAGHLIHTAQNVPLKGLAPAERVGDVARIGSCSGALLRHLDSAALLDRWLDNLADAQFPEGGFPAVVPTPPGEEAWCGAGLAGTSDAFLNGLWQLFRHCGDRRALRRHFPAVKQMLAGQIARSPGLVVHDLEADTSYPADLAATAWLYRSTRLAARIAGVLGNLSDLEDYQALAAKVARAFRQRFVTPDGRVIGDDIAVYSLTLGCGLLDGAARQQAVGRLSGACEAALRGSAVDAKALLGVPLLLQVLTDLGRLDLAYRILVEQPGPGDDPGALLAAGVDEWLFRNLLGLRASRDLAITHNAFRHMVVEPRPPLGIRLGQPAGEPLVRAVEGSLTTINGRFDASWEITDDAFELRVLVPGNCSATIRLPDGTEQEVDAGSHFLLMPFDAVGDGIPVLREVS
jgi:alpha-L-rhamnosidase